MPIYTYRCNQCDHQFDQRQRMSDDPLTLCPICEGDLRRVVNSVGVVFKGSGFYVTDNRSNNSANSHSRPTSSDKDETDSKTAVTATADSKTSTGASTGASVPA